MQDYRYHDTAVVVERDLDGPVGTYFQYTQPRTAADWYAMEAQQKQ